MAGNPNSPDMARGVERVSRDEPGARDFVDGADFAGARAASCGIENEKRKVCEGAVDFTRFLGMTLSRHRGEPLRKEDFAHD
jgi:hypothetical protein